MGGRAFDGTQRINREDIYPTLNYLGKIIDVDNYYLRTSLLGSGGKKPTSGDIDVNMDERKFDLDEIATRLQAALPEDNIWVQAGNHRIFTKLPIRGDETRGFVQCDLMFGNYAWQVFGYFSDGGKHKGLFRTNLIRAMVSDRVDSLVFEDGELIARAGPVFNSDTGVEWICKHREWKRNGKGRKKRMDVITEEAYSELYEPVHFPMKINNDPNWVMNWLIPEATESAFYNFDSLWAALNKYQKDRLPEIAKLYWDRITNVKEEIPDDIRTKVQRAMQ